MPLLSITTNAPTDGAASALGDISAAVAELLGKPERYVMVNLTHNPDMMFAGSSEPLAYLELKSIGLPAERTREFSAALCGLVGEKLGIFPDRVYIEFTDAPRQLWGWNTTTF